MFDWYQQRHIRIDGPEWVYLYNFPRLNDTCGYADKIAVYALRHRGTRSDAGETPLWRTAPCANAAVVRLNFVGLALRNLDFQSEGGRCHFLGFADCLNRDQVRAVITISSDPEFKYSPGEGQDGAATLTNQEYGLSEIPLSDQCGINCSFDSHFRRDNNFIDVTIRDDTDVIPLNPYVIDRDGHEEICGINPFAYQEPDYPLHARSVLEWQRIQQTNRTVAIRGSTRYGQCEFTIMPVGAPASP